MSTRFGIGVVLAAALLTTAPPAVAQQDGATQDEAKTTLAARFEAAKKKFDAAQAAFFEVYKTAKTDEERQQIVKEKYPKPKAFAADFWEIVEADPTSDPAGESLAWIFMAVREAEVQENALEPLMRYHAHSERMAGVAQSMQYAMVSDKEKETVLRQLMEESPHAAVRGHATMSLARVLKSTGHTDDFERLMELAREKYADVPVQGSTLAKVAEGELFAFRKLRVGKEAPEIEGKDLDGVAFKLSDYRGKVVFLDFWGDW